MPYHLKKSNHLWLDKYAARSGRKENCSVFINHVDENILRLRSFFSSRRRHTILSCDWSSDVCSSDLRRRHTRLSCDWSSDVCSSDRSEEHTSELQSHDNLVCRLLLEIGRTA